jgi:hypothetical protein
VCVYVSLSLESPIVIFDSFNNDYRVKKLDTLGRQLISLTLFAYLVI